MCAPYLTRNSCFHIVFTWYVLSIIAVIGGASGSGDSNAREQKDNKKKNDLYKDEVKSDALLAKIERLRQEKAEKAAKKAQAKAAKKGGG